MVVWYILLQYVTLLHIVTMFNMFVIHLRLSCYKNKMVAKQLVSVNYRINE